MTELHYTLVSDGSSDKALIPVLDWLIRQCDYQGYLQGECCDFRLFRSASRSVLAEKIRYALILYPCDVLFIHRDAEKASPAKRVQEIANALNQVFARSIRKPSVCVVPVRMTEAWLLFNENAIRRAAGNPSGRGPLHLPDLRTLESLPDPKEVLRNLIRQATGLGARRQEAFPISQSILQIAQYIDDFSPLRSLNAFRQLESDVHILIANCV